MTIAEKKTGIRDRLLQLVEMISREEQQRLKLLEPDAIYHSGQEDGSEPGEYRNGSRENFDWFTIGMGKKIRKQRTALGITQAELARRMHVSSTTISRMESGKVNLCGQDINRLCRELNCSLLDIWPDESVIKDRTPDRKVIIEAMRRLLEEMDREMEDDD